MRLLHTMLRVTDMQRSIDFYTKVLGMRLLRTSENTEYKYSLAFVGYSDESEGAVIELTYNWGLTNTIWVTHMVISLWASMMLQKHAMIYVVQEVT